ncbi:hypothetical protein HDV00_000830 [Rhizophlyctis rosea]|nr:hypothetical protein HDV00_000830 [Rhizophlyctis rosea]
MSKPLNRVRTKLDRTRSFLGTAVGTAVRRKPSRSPIPETIVPSVVPFHELSSQPTTPIDSHITIHPTPGARSFALGYLGVSSSTLEGVVNLELGVQTFQAVGLFVEVFIGHGFGMDGEESETDGSHDAKRREKKGLGRASTFKDRTWTLSGSKTDIHRRSSAPDRPDASVNKQTAATPPPPNTPAPSKPHPHTVSTPLDTPSSITTPTMFYRRKALWLARDTTNGETIPLGTYAYPFSICLDEVADMHPDCFSAGVMTKCRVRAVLVPASEFVRPWMCEIRPQIPRYDMSNHQSRPTPLTIRPTPNLTSPSSPSSPFSHTRPTSTFLPSPPLSPPIDRRRTVAWLTGATNKLPPTQIAPETPVMPLDYTIQMDYSAYGFGDDVDVGVCVPFEDAGRIRRVEVRVLQVLVGGEVEIEGTSKGGEDRLRGPSLDSFRDGHGRESDPECRRTQTSLDLARRHDTKKGLRILTEPHVLGLSTTQCNHPFSVLTPSPEIAVVRVVTKVPTHSLSLPFGNPMKSVYPSCSHKMMTIRHFAEVEVSYGNDNAPVLPPADSPPHQQHTSSASSSQQPAISAPPPPRTPTSTTTTRIPITLLPYSRAFGTYLQDLRSGAVQGPAGGGVVVVERKESLREAGSVRGRKEVRRAVGVGSGSGSGVEFRITVSSEDQREEERGKEMVAESKDVREERKSPMGLVNLYVTNA